MNENVGASFGLSVLMVVFFAVVLYQPESPPPPAASMSPPTASAEPTEAHPPEGSPAAPTVNVEPPAAQSERVVGVARPVSRRSPRAPEPVERRGAFTKVREGETLDDVARRVYGGDDGLATLWAANRDLLDRIDAPVAAGSFLRTP